MKYLRALSTTLIFTFLILLSLPSTGVAKSAALVESRSQPAVSPSDWNPAEKSSPGYGALELTQKMEFLQQEVQELRGKVEEQNYQLQQLQEQQKKLYLDLDRRLQEGKTQTHGVTNLSLDDPSDIAETGMTLTFLSAEGSEEKAYQDAYHLVQNKDYERGLLAFQSLIKNFPQGKYVPNAYYWLGEIALAKGDLEEAADAFLVVFQKYVSHPKAADSLLKLGYVEYDKGEFKQAEAYFNQVKDLFPDTTSAQLAQTRLQQMEQVGNL